MRSAQTRDSPAARRRRNAMMATHRAECLMYECRFPIFDETLWLAFGDGASQKRAMLT
jgi:hypothetical protein